MDPGIKTQEVCRVGINGKFINHTLNGVKLPFLKNNRWPIIREDKEQVANPGYDTKLQDHLVLEIMDALETRDHSKFTDAIVALIKNILNEDV